MYVWIKGKVFVKKIWLELCKDKVDFCLKNIFKN